MDNKIRLNIRALNITTETDSEAKSFILEQIHDLPKSKRVANCIMLGIPNKLIIVYPKLPDEIFELLSPFKHISNIQIFETECEHGLSITEIDEITSRFISSLEASAKEIKKPLDPKTNKD